MTEVDELYILARRVLLDALAALGDHRAALILVGAQAVYLRVGQADLAVAPFTTDGDLAIDPSILTKIPPLEKALIGAGFHPQTKDSVGIWITERSTSQQAATKVAIDLLVPASVSPGSGRRAAKLSGHSSRAARIVRGLEGAIVDAEVMTLAALEPSDARSQDLRVAGPAALLIAKLHKINERQGTDRLNDKDALDVFRLLRGTTADDLAARYEKLLRDARSQEAARAAREFLETQFATRAGVGIEMVIRSIGALGDADEIRESCLSIAEDLLTTIKN
jgi:hypothetical protein